MSVYAKNGQALDSVYGVDGSTLAAAYNASGEQIFPDGPMPVKCMSYNVGSWTNFGNKATAANQEFWYALQNSIFANENADLCGIQEYYSQIGSYHVPTMLGQYFPYFYAVDRQSNPTKAGRALCSKFPMTNTQEINFQNQNGEVRSYLIGDVNIGGKTVKFLTAHLALTTSTIILQIQELLQAVSNFDYWILTGDFNLAFPDTESSGYQNLVKPFLDAGYHVANGSTFGFIPTFSTKAPGDDSDWRVLDNIMCSANIEITDVYVDTEKLTTLTTQGIDHLPLIAEMQILPDPPPSEDWLDTAIATALPSYSVSGIKQGACTDGTYFYLICFDSDAYTSGTFVKYRISDGTYTTTTFDGSVSFGHGNDMCYNPNNNHIYVLCMSTHGKIVELDTDFNVIAVHYFVDENGEPYYSNRVAFDRKTNTFVTGTAYDFIVADQNFGYVRKITMPQPPESTGQGGETDGDFIYRLQYNPGYILVTDMYGNFVKTITHTIPNEAEAIMYDWATGKMYVSRYTNATGYIYEVQLKA